MPDHPEVFFSEYSKGHKQADWLDFALVQFKFCTTSLISLEDEQGIYFFHLASQIGYYPLSINGQIQNLP